MARVPIINASDNRIGIIAAIIFTLVVFAMLWLITFQEPDPPKVTIPIPITMAESGIDEFEVETNKGGGSPSESTEVPAKTEESPKEQATQEESDVEVNRGSGSSTTKTQPNTNETSASPFSGDSNGGEGTRQGSGFGSDTGPNSGDSGSSNANGGTRIRLGNIKTKPQTENNESVVIALKLTVDWRGTVLRAEYIRRDSTTDNMPLIEEVIELTKKEVKYKPRKEGSINETLFYTVRLTPEGSYVVQ